MTTRAPCPHSLGLSGSPTLRIVLSAALGLAIAWPRGATAAEPVYQGEKFSRLIELSSPEKIATAALELGLSNSLPYLLDALEERDSILDKAKMGVWKQLPAKVKSSHLRQMPMPADSTRIKALLTLNEIGIEAHGAVPAVVRLFEVETNRAVRTWRLDVLASIGRDSPEAISVLTKSLREPEPEPEVALRAAAAIGLGYIGPPAASAVPALVEEVRRPESKTLPWALAALGQFGPAASNALPVLLDVLRSGTNTPSTLYSLRGLGPAATPAMPDLVKIIESRQPGYAFAVESLLYIGPAARACVPMFESLLADTNAIVRILASTAMAQVGGAYDTAVPRLVEELENPARGSGQWSPPGFRYVRGPSMSIGPNVTAAWFLGELGAAAHSAVPALKHVIQNPAASRNPWLGVVTARALWKIEGKANEIVPVLANATRPVARSSQTTECLAAMTLGEMGPAAQAAIPQLEEAQVQGGQGLRRHATLALRRIRERAP